MCLSRCIVSFRDTKTTTGTTTKLFIRPDNLRVLVLGFIDLLPFQPVQQFITSHQQSVSNVECRETRVMEYAVGGRAWDAKVKTYTFQNKRQAVLFCDLPFLLTQSDLRGSGGTPQKCACGWPHAMLAKHVPAQSGSNQSGYAYKFTYTPEWISLDSSKNLDSKKWISSDSLRKIIIPIYRSYQGTAGVILHSFWKQYGAMLVQKWP